MAPAGAGGTGIVSTNAPASSSSAVCQMRAATARMTASGAPSTGVKMLINAASKAPFSYQDACVEQNPHVNHDAEATAAAMLAARATDSAPASWGPPWLPLPG